MNIPSLPINDLIEKITDVEGKPSYRMHPAWNLFFRQLQYELQKNLSEESIVLPQQSTSNISLLTNYTGGIIYDNTLNVGKINLNGVWKTITTS